MATFLMNIRGVPDDELDEIRELLDEHRLEFYETQPSWWGFGAGGIWLYDDSRADEARRLLHEYQRQRYHSARAEYKQRQRTGNADTWGSKLREQPVRLLALLVIVAVILYFSISPFFAL